MNQTLIGCLCNVKAHQSLVVPNSTTLTPRFADTQRLADMAKLELEFNRTHTLSGLEHSAVGWCTRSSCSTAIYMLGLTFPAFLLSQTVSVTILKLGEDTVMFWNIPRDPGGQLREEQHSPYNSIDLANISGDIRSGWVSSMRTVHEGNWPVCL